MWRTKVLYQYFIALPILIVVTLISTIIVIVFYPWKNSWCLHQVQIFWSRLFCWIFFIPVTVKGLENIRKNQSYVFVANHESVFDIFAIYGWLPVVFKWLMKKEISRIPFVGFACRALGHISVDRSNVRAAAESIRTLERELHNGVSTVIFPEGTRSENGKIGRFKHGAFHIAKQLNMPIIPICLDGCYEVMNRHAKTITRHPITVTILPEVDMNQFDDIEEAVDTVRNLIIAAK